MPGRALEVFAGRVARARIAEHGWDPELFELLLGASGGPKWLVLSQLDRVLFGDFLRRRSAPLPVLGTSIGSWRHACLAQDDHLAALGRLEERYIHQRFSPRPGPEEVTAVSRAILDHLLGEGGARQLVESRRIATQIVAVRGRGPGASRRPGVQRVGLALAALSNALHRRCLQVWYQRVVFATDGDGRGSGMRFDDFSTAYARLTAANVVPALLASGSIPVVLEGVRDPPGAPPGQYWDGGVVDYHHDLRAYRGDGLVLYPHFFPDIIPGWFDKALPWRRSRDAMLDHVVLMAPSETFVGELPGGKIPDRRDFHRLDPGTRIETWWRVVKRCEALAHELTDLLAQADPLAGVRSFPAGASSPADLSAASG